MRIARVIGVTLLAVSLRAGGRWASCDNPSEPPDVTIYVDGVSPQFVLAKCLAGQMLRPTGVRVVWRAGEPREDAAGSVVVAVRFTDAPSVDHQHGALARTWPFAGGVRRIDVFRNRVSAFAGRSGIEEFKLTAHVLVHEIGHVLERLDRHSSTGVMKAHWTSGDFRAMGGKPLPFAQEDLEWIGETLKDLRARRVKGANDIIGPG